MADPVVAPPEEDFDKLFAEAAAAAEAQVQLPTPPTEPPAPPEVPPAAPPAAPEAPPAALPEAPLATPPAESPAAPPETPPVAPPAAPPASPAAPPAPPPEPEESPEAKAAREAFEESIRPYEPSAEEKAADAKFKADFPEEYRAMEARMKALERQYNARLHNTVQAYAQHFTAALTPVAEQVNATSVEQHVAALHAAHSDYDAVIDKVPAWIATQPAYLRTAMQQVYDGGTAADVIALVADFKKATGAALPATPPASPPAAPLATPPAVPPVRPKPAGADDLAPVAAKRVAAVPKGTPDANDFEGAWKESVAALG